MARVPVSEFVISQHFARADCSLACGLQRPVRGSIEACPIAILAWQASHLRTAVCADGLGARHRTGPHRCAGANFCSTLVPDFLCATIACADHKS